MLAGAFSCHHLNAHRGDEYIVPEASDGDVTDTACPGRILLVEQQVSLPLFKDRNRHTSDFPRRTKPACRSLTKHSQGLRESMLPLPFAHARLYENGSETARLWVYRTMGFQLTLRMRSWILLQIVIWIFLHRRRIRFYAPPRLEARASGSFLPFSRPGAASAPKTFLTCDWLGRFFSHARFFLGGSTRSYLDNLGSSSYLRPRRSRSYGGEGRCLHLAPNCCKAH
jgi:hypothetical protein